ncbi:MAG: hypothetical protein PHT30_02310 [Bacilli bacterium]|nr:hypothetical protein [Bacilli bacterium]
MPLTKRQKRLLAIRRNYAKKSALKKDTRFVQKETIKSSSALAQHNAKKSMFYVPIIYAGELGSSKVTNVRASSAKEAEEIVAKQLAEQNSKREIYDRVYIDKSRFVIG